MADTGITGRNILPTHMLYVTVHTQLHNLRHVRCLRLPQWRLFGKEAIFHLPVTQTRCHICSQALFYLKGASDTWSIRTNWPIFDLHEEQQLERDDVVESLARLCSESLRTNFTSIFISLLTFELKVFQCDFRSNLNVWPLKCAVV